MSTQPPSRPVTGPPGPSNTPPVRPPAPPAPPVPPAPVNPGGGPARVLNWKPQPREQLLGLPMLGVRKRGPVRVPPKVDMGRGWFDLPDQGGVGACVAFATVSAMEYVARTNAIAPFKLSQRFAYYTARVDILGQPPADDTGTYVNTVVQALQKYGAPPLDVWPYREANGAINFAEKPSPSAYSAASRFQVVRAIQIEIQTESLKAALAVNAPVVIGFVCYPNLYDPETSRTGVIQMPQQGATTIGGHCVLLVGYDDTTQRFKFRNSWGNGWGDKGYGYLPYAYMERSDAWSIRTVENDDNVIRVLRRANALKFGLDDITALPADVAGSTPGTPVRPTLGAVSPSPGASPGSAAASPGVPSRAELDPLMWAVSTAGTQMGEQLKSLDLEPQIDEHSYVINDVKVGYVAATSAGTTVQIGRSSELTFTLTVKGVTIPDLQAVESDLYPTLAQEQEAMYSALAATHGGGFNVPVLSWFGINANSSYNKDVVEAVRAANPSYDAQAAAVAAAINAIPNQTLTLTGKLVATGISQVPTYVTACVKVLQLKLTNGKYLNVVCTNASDVVVAADESMRAVPTKGQALTVSVA